MEWTTDRRIGMQTGILFIIGLVVLDFVLIGVIGTQPISFTTFISVLTILASLPLVTLIVYQLIGLNRSGYSLDRNTLTISWGPIHQLVPTASIERIMLGHEVQGRIKKFRGWRWPGLAVGQAEVPEAGLTLFYASAPRQQQLVIITPMLSYVISPTDIPGFIEAIKARYELGPTQNTPQTSIHPALFDWALWRERIAIWFEVLACGLCAALFAFMCLRYPNLPKSLPLHYSLTGEADRFGSPAQLFILPVIGLIALLGNTAVGGLVYRRERMAAYVLWGGAILVQVLLWIGAINLLRA